MTTIETPPVADDDVETFVEKLFTAVLGAQQVQGMYLGLDLGYYDVLATGPHTSASLATATGTDERYTREWLEHQTVAGYVTCRNPGADAASRSFHLTTTQAEVLTDRESLAFVAPLAQIIAGLGINLDRMADAFRSGEGLSWADHHESVREAQAAANRPMFVRQLGAEYLASIPDVDAALRAGGRVADIGAGYGWSSVGVAQAYGDVTVDAFDLHGPSVEVARRNVTDAGLADRVTVHQADAAALEPDAPYDLVMALECIHDLADPVGVLATMRRFAGADGAVIVMDERVADSFTGESDEVEEVMYGYSIMCCLADCRSHSPSAATGTVMRRPTLEGYAREAGFTEVEVLGIDNDFFRFYRLR